MILTLTRDFLHLTGLVVEYDELALITIILIGLSLRTSGHAPGSLHVTAIHIQLENRALNELLRVGATT
jgi:hypothetical protein